MTKDADRATCSRAGRLMAMRPGSLMGIARGESWVVARVMGIVEPGQVVFRKVMGQAPLSPLV